jgi:hypothetical protein
MDPPDSLSLFAFPLQECELHTKRTGHEEFDDKTDETAKPISVEDISNAEENAASVSADQGADGEQERKINYFIFSVYLFCTPILLGNFCFANSQAAKLRPLR